MAATSGTPRAPFRECPAIGDDQSCGILIYLTDSGATVLSDSSQGPFDDDDDTLVGVLNASGKALSSLSLSSNTEIFGFDGDGICSGDYPPWTGDEGCPYGPTGYEGPGTQFAVNSVYAGSVVFTNTVQPRGIAYFSLEEALSSASLVNTYAYAALGDSYSSGQGTQNNSFSSACQRGPLAWPMVLGDVAGLAIDGSANSSANSFFACSGATSSQVLNGGGGQPNQVHELEQYAQHNGTPGLVTLTAGGDDVKFSKLLEKCVLDWGGGCAKALRGAISYMTTGRASFVTRLATLYKETAKAAGKGSRVEVVGYPRLFPQSGSFWIYSECPWLVKDTGGVLTLTSETENDLNGDIRQAAAQAHVNYASTENALQGHELCNFTPWIGPLDLYDAKVTKTAGHPLPSGQVAIASAVQQDLQNSGQPFVARQSVTKLRTLPVAVPSAARPLATPAAETLAIESSGVPSATVGAPYVGFLTASGGTEPYTWSVASGSLPAGLSLEPETGVISGEPTAAESSTFTIKATDSTSPTPTSTTKSVTIVSSAPATLAVTSEGLPPGTVGQQYTTTLESTGGTRPASWSIESGNLPNGLSLEPSTGVISGTPTSSGTSTVTFRATDSAEPTPQTATAKLKLSIVPETEPLSVTTTKLPAATDGTFYTADLTSTGGTAPIEWSVSSGALPDGLTLESSGVISGTPSATGTYSLTLTATDRATPSPHVANVSLSLVVNAGTPLSLLTASISSATQGSEYIANLNAEGGVPGYSWEVTSGALPPGVTLESSTGAIEGTPAESGVFTFTATVSDGSTPTAQTASQTYSLNVAASSPSIGFAPPEATVGEPYSYTPTVSGGVAPYSWSISSGELPTGLSLEPSTGAITGTPTTPGSNPVTLQVTDSSQPVSQGVTASATLTVAAVPPLQIASTELPAAVNGVPHRALIFTTGGTAPLSFSITHGTLPAGLSLDEETGVVSGTPSVEGTSEFTLRVSDSSQPSVVRTATMAVAVGAPPALSIATTELNSGTAGSSFTQTLIATGGTTPYMWSIASGSLPSGLSISESTGQISGTPTESGSFPITIKVSDSGSPTPQTASVALSLTVSPSSPLSLTTNSLSSGTQGTYYEETIEAQGGVPPYTWALSSGSLPEGLSLDSTTGTIYGLPTSYGTYSFTIQASDSTSPTPVTTSKSYSLKIAPAPELAVSATSLPGGTQGQYYDQSLGISGGVSPYSVTVTSGKLPEGLTLDQYGELYGEITGAQSQTFTLQIQDSSTPQAQTISRQYTIDVTAAPPLELSSTVGSFVVGEYGEQSLGVTGGVPGYSWTTKASKLPAGLTFSNGVIYGTPTKTGKGSLTVTVTDAATPTAHTVTKTLSAAVVKPPKLKIATTKLPNAVRGNYYQQQITVTGGSPPYTWSISAGALPPGMSLSGEWIYGTPETAGKYTFTVRVTDSGSPKPQTTTKTLKLKVT